MRNKVVIVGYGARLPGTESLEDVWRVFLHGRSTISEIPATRWSASRFLHPEHQQAGRTYTRAAGVLEDPFGFDADYFRISRREAEQMDPQQRLLLETTAHAFDHAGIDPAALDGSRTGVFVGASASDHSTSVQDRPDLIGPHFMLGNTLSILSNRLSYMWDFRGPSLTVDTACSSALVALDLARSAIERGEIDTAVVAGVNLLLSPIPFVGFSQALMLSTRGICAPFSAEADGYVRSEGAVVFVLQRQSLARKNGIRIRSALVATAVNADGKTSGLPLPSGERQGELITSIIERFGINPDDLAFIEAHGTGTPVGDPREAWAIGTAYGRHRNKPLPISSAKANFGHLEPAAGLVGLLKAQLCLEHGFIPMMPHARNPNPQIDFEGLNLRLPGTGEWLRARDGGWCAAINAFGFGGANAHAVLRQVAQRPAPGKSTAFPPSLLISAASAASLKTLATAWKDLAASGETHGLAARVATANRRLARHPYRICLDAGSASRLDTSIAAWLGSEGTPTRAAGSDLPVGFLFSGNGTAWAGMARDIFDADTQFTTRFKEAAAAFHDLGLADVEALLFNHDLASRLDRAEIAQPLIFCLQVALAHALSAQGVRPAATLGHSVGECSAAVVAGRLDLREAARIVANRCAAFDPLYRAGGMAALNASIDETARLIADLGVPVDIAAENARHNVTVSGANDAIEAVLRGARARRISGLRLDIAYPYHSNLVDRVSADLIERLGPVDQTFSTIGFFSGWLGKKADDVALDETYWHANARRMVAFRSAVTAMAEDGIGVFLEISPRTALVGNIRDTLAQTGRPHAVLASLRKVANREATPRAIARAIASAGGRVDEDTLLGRRRTHSAPVPDYPFQHESLNLKPAAELSAQPSAAAEHELLGRRTTTEDWVWIGSVSRTRLPWLADHKVRGEVVLPAMAMLDIFRHAALEIVGGPDFELRDIAFLKPVVLDHDHALATRMSYDPLTRLLTLAIVVGTTFDKVAEASLRSGVQTLTETIEMTRATMAPGLYESLAMAGLSYGAHFARLSGVARSTGTEVDVTLDDHPDPSPTAARICRSDAALHGLALLFQADSLRVPYRIGRARFAQGGEIMAARLTSNPDASVSFSVRAVDASNSVVLLLDDLLLASLPDTKGKFQTTLDEIQVPARMSGAGRIRALKRSPDIAKETRSNDLDVLRTALAGRLAWDLALGDPQRQDETRRRFAISWLKERNLVESSGQRVIARGNCPWPSLDELIVLLTHSIGHASDELASILLAAVAGDSAHRRPLSRARRLATRILEDSDTIPGRVLLAGDLDTGIVQAALNAGHHVTIAAGDDSTLRQITSRLEKRNGFAIATFQSLSDAEPFDLALGISALSLKQADIGRFSALCRSAGEICLIDEVPDAFSILSYRYERHADFAAALRLFGPLESEPVTGDAALIVHHGRPDHSLKSDPDWSAQVVGTCAFAQDLRTCLGPESGTVRLIVLPSDATSFDRFKAMRSGDDAQTTWIISRNAQDVGELTGLRRVVRNETQRDIRVASVDPDVTPQEVIAALANSREQEIIIDHSGGRGIRLAPVPEAARADSQRRSLLLPGHAGQGGTPRWVSQPRVTPGDGEIEIKVEASGLNFRDIMLASGALPEDAFLGGYAGLSLGIECAGTVVRRGPHTRHAIGDRITTFAAGGFASHVTVPQDLSFGLPPEMSACAGATLPVAFLTADYALRDCARLEDGETVLIHGGAGGVGLAAIQIAHAMGLRVIATAGSPEKRRLLHALGVDHVFDSRSLAFADLVRRATDGRGVDAVINALSGQFLVASLECLAPFGRFVELGKRDFFANTPLGLRAMRQNIAFFAVDADQLIRERPAIARRVLERLSDAFLAGRLTPLPQSVFPATDIKSALDRMRRAEHIGKIVVTAPDERSDLAPEHPDYRGTWLITGGTRGFGLATAGWLAARGAGSLWLISRSGRIDATDRAGLERSGATVHTIALDITDAAAVDRLIETITAKDQRLDGIVHAAMVLDDAPVAEIDRARLEAVMRPKIGGARLLDHATRGQNLAHFWLYSSVAVRFGNPGQAAYVAANGALEDLARHRKAQGLPALAIAWPPIRDAGYLRTQTNLKDRIEASGMPALAALDALDLLDKALCNDPERATLTIAPADWSRLARSVPVLQDSLFELMQRDSGPGAEEAIDIRTLVIRHGAEEAQRRIIAILLEEFAVLLRLPKERLDANLTLGEIGFDSLLATQLRLTIEERLGQTLSPNLLSDAMTFAGLAKLLVAGVTDPHASAPSAVAMMESHLSDPEIILRVRSRMANAQAEILS